MLVKICGLTRPQDVDAASAFGADAVGFVLWPRSPRFVTTARLRALAARLPQAVTPVGVFVAPTEAEVADALDAGVRVLQIHGVSSETLPQSALAPTWIAASLDTDLTTVPMGATLLLDAADSERVGGTGRTIDWARAADVARQRPLVLAGGLHAGNVAAAIHRVRPFGVDVSSGVEVHPGIKNPEAMRAFIAAVRETEAACSHR